MQTCRGQAACNAFRHFSPQRAAGYNLYLALPGCCPPTAYYCCVCFAARFCWSGQPRSKPDPGHDTTCPSALIQKTHARNPHRTDPQDPSVKPRVPLTRQSIPMVPHEHMRCTALSSPANPECFAMRNRFLKNRFFFLTPTTDLSNFRPRKISHDSKTGQRSDFFHTS